MQSIIAIVAAVSSFGVAYVANMALPTPVLGTEDILLNQSISDTLNFYTRDDLIQMKKTPKELIDMYIRKQANLLDILQLITQKDSLEEALASLRSNTTPNPETKFLLKAIKQHIRQPAPTAPKPPQPAPTPAPTPAPKPQPVAPPTPPPIPPRQRTPNNVWETIPEKDYEKEPTRYDYRRYQEQETNIGVPTENMYQRKLKPT